MSAKKRRMLRLDDFRYRICNSVMFDEQTKKLALSSVQLAITEVDKGNDKIAIDALVSTLEKLVPDDRL